MHIPHKPSALIDTRVIYCGENFDQLRKLAEKCVDLIYIDPPFNSNRNYEVFWRETKEKTDASLFILLGGYCKARKSEKSLLETTSWI